jgi:hypothetical protein
MLSPLTGRLSAHLLAGKSNHTVSRASLYFALGLAVFIALLSGIFALAQWQLGADLAKLHQERARNVETRIGTSADMASQQANAHRATLNVLLSRDSAELDEAEALRRSNLQSYVESSRLIGANAGLHEAAEELRLLTAQYEELSAQVVDLFRDGQREAALDLRVRRLREAFNRWQEAHASFSTQLARTEAEQMKDYEEATAGARRWLVGLLVGPLVLLALGILTIAGMLGASSFRKQATDVWSR